MKLGNLEDLDIPTQVDTSQHREVTVHFFYVFLLIFCGIAPDGMMWND